MSVNPHNNLIKLIPFIVPILQVGKLSPETATKLPKVTSQTRGKLAFNSSLSDSRLCNLNHHIVLPTREPNSILISSSRNQQRQKASASCPAAVTLR